MLKITIESLNAKEPAVEWVGSMLQFKQVGYRVRAAKKVNVDGIVYVTVFEKRSA